MHQAVKNGGESDFQSYPIVRFKYLVFNNNNKKIQGIQGKKKKKKSMAYHKKNNPQKLSLENTLMTYLPKDLKQPRLRELKKGKEKVRKRICEQNEISAKRQNLKRKQKEILDLKSTINCNEKFPQQDNGKPWVWGRERKKDERKVACGYSTVLCCTCGAPHRSTYLDESQRRRGRKKGRGNIGNDGLKLSKFDKTYEHKHPGSSPKCK